MGGECGLLDHAGLLLLAQEERQEFQGQIHKGGEIRLNFRMEFGEIYFRRLRQVEDALHAGIEEDAVQVWIRVRDTVGFVSTWGKA